MNNKEQVIQLYDQALFYRPDPEDTLCHLSSKEDAVSYGAYLTLLLNRLGNDCTICDLGCGTASPVRYSKLATAPPKGAPRARSAQYTGLDINETMIKRAQERWKDRPDMQFKVYDLEDCNLDQNYDIILLQESIAYFEEEEINELVDYYVTKANKVLSLSLLDGDLPWSVQDELLIAQRHPMTTIVWCLANYPFVLVDHGVNKDTFRIDIFKTQEYFDLVRGIEGRETLGTS